MRVTKGQLKRIIREEMTRLHEDSEEDIGSDVEGGGSTEGIEAPAEAGQGEDKEKMAARMEVGMWAKDQIVASKGLLSSEFPVFRKMIEEILALFDAKNLAQRKPEDVDNAMKQVYLKMKAGTQKQG